MLEPVHERGKSVDLDQYESGAVDSALEQGRAGGGEAAVGDWLSTGYHTVR